MSIDAANPSAVRPRVICLHGAESTGKSWLALRLGTTLGCPVVPEYGRLYCEDHGNDVNADELVHIAQIQQQMIEEARHDAVANGVPWVVTDTDAVITAVWASMMLGFQPESLEITEDPADLYLVGNIDLPWTRDNIRLYGNDVQRTQFHAQACDELEKRGLRWALVSGTDEARYESAVAAIKAAFPDATIE